MKPVVVAILGPTATGKSALALAMAERYGGEIVNCDSTAVFRGFDIGTDKVPFAESVKLSGRPPVRSGDVETLPGAGDGYVIQFLECRRQRVDGECDHDGLLRDFADRVEELAIG